MQYIPDRHTLESWRDEMKRVKKSDPKSYFYAESSLVCFDDHGIKGMLQITEAIDFKRAVEKELDWFAST